MTTGHPRRDAMRVHVLRSAVMRAYFASQLAALLGLPVRGPEAPGICGAASLAEATAGDISFVGTPKFFAVAAASQAGCLIASHGPNHQELCARSAGSHFVGCDTPAQA